MPLSRRLTVFLDVDGQLTGGGVRVEAGRSSGECGRARALQRELVLPGHAVQRLGQVGGPLQDDLLQSQAPSQAARNNPVSLR